MKLKKIIVALVLAVLVWPLSAQAREKVIDDGVVPNCHVIDHDFVIDCVGWDLDVNVDGTGWLHLVVEVADENGSTVYNYDKYQWLSAPGQYYYDEDWADQNFIPDDSLYQWSMTMTFGSSYLTESGEFRCEPTCVTLADFSVEPTTRSIIVSWETVSEANNLGFNLYRAKSLDGAATKLNSELISSKVPGSSEGASYEYVDKAVRPGITYYYWLEDVDTSGISSFHGPVSAELLKLPLPLTPEPNR